MSVSYLYQLKTQIVADSSCSPLVAKSIITLTSFEKVIPRVISGSSSNVSSNINMISKYLNCSYSDVLKPPCEFRKYWYISKYIFSCNDTDDQIICGNTCDLIYIRDRDFTGFHTNEVNDMLDFLCTP